MKMKKDAPETWEEMVEEIAENNRSMDPMYFEQSDKMLTEMRDKFKNLALAIMTASNAGDTEAYQKAQRKAKFIMANAIEHAQGVTLLMMLEMQVDYFEKQLGFLNEAKNRRGRDATT